jgi:hypothetical protein
MCSSCFAKLKLVGGLQALLRFASRVRPAPQCKQGAGRLSSTSAGETWNNSTACSPWRRVAAAGSVPSHAAAQRHSPHRCHRQESSLQDELLCWLRSRGCATTVHGRCLRRSWWTCCTRCETLMHLPKARPTACIVENAEADLGGIK